MDAVSGNKTSVTIQMGLADSVLDLLALKPVFLLGIIIIGISLVIIFKSSDSIPKMKTTVVSLIMYYYMCLLLTNIVGIPTLSEYIRLSKLGEAFFNPKINLIPLRDGFSLSFILNIFLFIPLGFLCPMISKKFKRARNTIFIGLGLSFFVEISQLFTLYRVTDIDDLLTNVFGTAIGYLCFRLIAKRGSVKLYSNQQSEGKDFSEYLPVIIIAAAFVLGFFS